MGGSGLGVDPHQELAEALLGQQVEPDGRLVEEEDGGLVEHARHQLAAHPLAEREVADRDVEQLGGIEQLGQLVEAGWPAGAARGGGSPPGCAGTGGA